jgi:hypothetical protein
VDMNIPLITNRQLAEAFVTALHERMHAPTTVRSWNEYLQEH